MSKEKNTNIISMTEREIMTDSLDIQKKMTEAYNHYAADCDSESLRNTFLSILNDEHDIHMTISDEMNARGWQKSQQAEQTEILKAKQRFSENG